jgi:hypothetical protein
MKVSRCNQASLLLAVLAVSVCADAAQEGRTLLARQDAQLTPQVLAGQAVNERGHHGKYKYLHGKRAYCDKQATCSLLVTEPKGVLKTVQVPHGVCYHSVAAQDI